MPQVFGYVIEDEHYVIAHNEAQPSMAQALSNVACWISQLGPTFGTVKITVGEVDQDLDTEVRIRGYAKKGG